MRWLIPVAVSGVALLQCSGTADLVPMVIRIMAAERLESDPYWPLGLIDSDGGLCP
jgi:hypothetical protein